MTVVGLDPGAAPGLARVLRHAGVDLEQRAADVASLLAHAGVDAGVAATLRGVSVELQADAADLLGRTRDLLADGDRFFAELWGYLGGDVLNGWNGGPDDAMPWGQWLAGGTRVLRGSVYVARSAAGRVPNPLPLFNNGLVGRGLQRLPALAWLRSPATTATLRWAGAAGGLYTGATGTVDLVRQGNPLEAYRREGAGYVADVAGTAFGYSSAAFFLTGNPVAGGAMVVSGAVWLGAEAWDHREDIAEAWNGATGWAGDRLDDAGGLAAGIAEDAAGLAGDVLGGAAGAAGGVADAVTFWN